MNLFLSSYRFKTPMSQIIRAVSVVAVDRIGHRGEALMYPSSWAHLLGVVLQLLVGLWLFLGTATLARWVEKARS
jgi:hypothetical protein